MVSLSTTQSKSRKSDLLQASPEIRILDSQIRITDEQEESTDAFTQSCKEFPSFTVRVMVRDVGRKWEFYWKPESTYTLRDVLNKINKDVGEDGFILNEDGVPVSVAGFPIESPFPKSNTKTVSTLILNTDFHRLKGFLKERF